MDVMVIRENMVADRSQPARPGASPKPAGLRQRIVKHRGTSGTGAPQPVRRRRLADHRRERPAERAQAGEPDVQADVGDAAPGRAQQVHRAFEAPALQVAVRRLAERRPEDADEVVGRHVRDPGDRGDVERLGVDAVHRVAGAQHPPVALLHRAAHPRDPTRSAPRGQPRVAPPRGAPPPRAPTRPAPGCQPGGGATAGAGGARARGRRRDTATPARQRAPPTRATGVGSSPSSAHDISTTMPGTVNVVEARTPALSLVSAKAHSAKPTAVGKTPRYTTAATAAAGACASSVTACGAKGRRTTAPTAQPSQVAVSASAVRSATFWRSTPAAYRTAVTRPRTTPTRSVRPDAPSAAMIMTPVNDTRIPTSSRRGQPSPSSAPAATAT